MKTPLCHRVSACTAFAFATAAYAQPANDTCATAIPVANHSVTHFNTIGATADHGNPCSDYDESRNIWYSYTAAGPEQLTVSTCGSTKFNFLAVLSGCGGAVLACSEGDACDAPDNGPPYFSGFRNSRVSFLTPGAGTYLICVTGLAGAEGPGVLNLDATGIVTAPTHDDCSNPLSIAGNEVLASFDTTGLTNDGASGCGGFNDGWYAWTPTVSGIGVASTCRLTNANTVLSAFDGCGGSEIACNDNYCGGQSRIEFPVTAGVPVLIRIATFDGSPATGQISFTAKPLPANDTCSTAQAITGPGSTAFDSTFATTQGPSGPCNYNGQADGHDVFFRYTADSDNYVRFDTLGSPTADALTGVAVDTTLQVLDACDGAVISCNDDAGPIGVLADNLLSRTCPLWMTTGQTVIVRVATWGAGSAGFTGVLTTSLSAPPSAPYAAPAGAIPEPGDGCEEWINDLNFGCQGYTHGYADGVTPASLCGTYKGQSRSRTIPNPYNQLFNDLDVYQFTLTTADTVTITGQTQFNATCILLFDGCPANSFGTFNVNAACGTGSFTYTTMPLAAGTYRFAINNIDQNSICGANDEYWFHLAGTGACAPACPADLGASGGQPGHDGQLDNNDFIAFINYFFDANAAADFGTSGGLPGQDGLFDNNDFIAFINAFFAGCP